MIEQPALNAPPQYLVIGHITQDLQPDRSFRLGGTATYSALTAAKLGLTVGVLTSTNGHLAPFADMPWVIVHQRPALQTTIFENIYTGSHRKQYIRALAEVLTASDLLPGWERAPIVHIGPVCQEVAEDLIDAFPHSLLGITPQGFLRRWDAEGLVSPTAWQNADRMLERADVIVLSLPDLGGDQEQLAYYVRKARLLVLTIGANGAIVYQRGEPTHVPAYEVIEVDPTGAGDTFAAAFFIRYYETGDALEAARFANCVASFCVEGVGASNLPTRQQVEHRLRYGRLRK